MTQNYVNMTWASVRVIAVHVHSECEGVTLCSSSAD